MDLYSGRYIAILYEFFVSKLTFLTSEELAENLKCSSRTIKEDIKSLNAYLRQEQIGFIESVPGRGYQLIIEDQGRGNQLKLMIERSYEFFFDKDVGRIKLRIFILKKILAVPSLEYADLLNEVHLTQSALRRDFEWIREFLQSYDLKLKVVNDAIQVRGSELQRRKAMLEAFCDNYYGLDDALLVKEFDSLFYEEDQEYENIRHAFLNILRPEQIVINDLSTKKLSAYICLAKRRNAANCRLSVFSAEEIDEAEKLYEYSLVQKIFSDPLIAAGKWHDENEVIAFTRMLLTHRDIDLSRHRDVETIPPVYLLKASQNLQSTLDCLKNTVWQELFASELFASFERDFLSIVLLLTLRHRMDSNKEIQLVIYSKYENYNFTPLALELTRVFIYHLSSVMNCPVNVMNLSIIPSVFEYILKQVNYEYHRQNIAVVSTAGRIVAGYIANDLNKKFSRYIHSLAVLNLYEMRSLNFDDFDCVICDKNDYYKRYPIKFVAYTSMTSLAKDDLYGKVFKSGYDRHILDFMKRITKATEDVVSDNFNALVKCICFRHAAESKLTELENAILWKNSLISYIKRQCLIIFCDISHTQKEFIEFYRVSKFAKYAIVVSIDYGYDLSKIKLINSILDRLIENDDYFDLILRDTSAAYDQCFDDIIENQS